MAKIELQNQNFDMAHSYCSTILKHSPNLEESILVCFCFYYIEKIEFKIFNSF